MIVIFTRFSVLTESRGFNYGAPKQLRGGSRMTRLVRRLKNKFKKSIAAAKTAEDKKASLFSDERMEFRFTCFETITLPSLQAQSDRDFLHVVLYSPSLPEKWMQRLSGLSQRYGFELVPMNPAENFAEKYQEYCRNLYKQLPCKETWLATIRLDDDDALNLQYIGWIRSAAEKGYRDVVVSTHAGFTFWIGRGMTRLVAQSKPFMAVGLAYIEEMTDTPGTIGSCGRHERIFENNATLILPEKDAHLISAHVHNDSGRGLEGKDRQSSVPDADLLIRRTFNIDADLVRCAFG
ncbi:MAG: hypothetical protein DI533_15180 [Cereibacter sphaeroides]|uniref:Uncharacterized protein n=1 Tax=Cereibacter sphaeroides TaxID=1063 RepID=A0A2W5S7G5_CERSP|nr:MAG: hypothetical protein DI533_15180 [Cereibacter sphaeroides]